MLSLNICPGPANLCQTLYIDISCLPTSCQGPSCGLYFLLLTAHGRRTCQLKAHMCTAQPDAQPDTVTHIHVEECIMTSITKNIAPSSMSHELLLTQDCASASDGTNWQNKAHKNFVSAPCLVIFRPKVMHFAPLEHQVSVQKFLHTHCDVTCCRFCTCGHQHVRSRYSQYSARAASCGTDLNIPHHIQGNDGKAAPADWLGVNRRLSAGSSMVPHGVPAEYLEYMQFDQAPAHALRRL